MVDLKGKCIIVTGGGSGIGQAAALIMARAGGRVMIADMNERSGNETVAMIRGENGEAQFVRTDVSVEADVENMVHSTVAAFGRLDGAFNNAGMPPDHVPFLELPVGSWSRNIAINLTGVFFCMRHEIAAMLKAGGGSIVSTASVAGVFGHALSAEYCAAKHGVIGLTKSLAIEFGKRNIRVNAVLPGGTRTPMMIEAFRDAPHLEKERAEQTPIGRFAEPRELGEAAAWLISDASSYVTGASLAVDGGMTAGKE